MFGFGKGRYPRRTRPRPESPMNDLAEKALHGAVAARRAAVARPATSLGVAGFVAATLVVLAGGTVAATTPTNTLSPWLGLQTDHGLGGATPASLLLAAVAVLLVVWLLALEIVRRTAMPESRLWRVVAATTVPFALGPPLMDTAAYSGAAFGFVQRAGRSPYDSSPASLDNNPLVDAITPSARGVESVAGPLGSVLQHLAVPIGGGTELGAVIVLRVVGVISAVAIGRFAAELAGARIAAGPSDEAGVPRTAAVVLTAMNPLTLLYVVSSPHLDGPMLALGLAALAAARRRRWLPAAALAALAGSVAPPGLLLVPVVIVAHVLARWDVRWRVLLRDGLAAAAVLIAAVLVQPDGAGWIRAVSAQFSTTTPFSVPYAVGRVLTPMVPGASYDDLITGGRITAAAAATCVVGYLLVSAAHRSIERTAAYALLAIALLAPNLYPWYLLWGLMCLAPVALGQRRTAVLALTAAGCVLVPPGFGDTTATVVTAAGLAVIAVPLAVAELRRHRAAAAVSG